MLSKIRANDPHGCPQSSASTIALRSDTSEGATGMAKTVRASKQYWYGPNPSQLWFTIARAAKIDATKICHKCGFCATIVQSGQLADLAPVENSGRGGWPVKRAGAGALSREHASPLRAVGRSIVRSQPVGLRRLPESGKSHRKSAIARPQHPVVNFPAYRFPKQY